MNKLIIIDDTTCKKELDEFVLSHADHIKLLLTEEEYNIDLDTLIQQIHHVFDHQKIIFLKTDNNIIKLTSSDIFLIQESNNRLRIELVNGSQYALPETIDHYSNMLSPFNILQVNKNTLVNAGFIKRLIIDDGVLFCSNGTKVNIDHDKKDELIRKLNNIYK